METIKVMFANFKGTLILLGLLFFFMAIIGKIDAQWLKIDFSDAIQRGGLILLGLLSIILSIIIDKQNSPQHNKQKKSHHGDFEWQWAAENWYGRLTFDEINGQNIITQAKVGLIQKTRGQKDIESRIIMDGMILQLAPHSQGIFEVVENGINVEFSVQKKHRENGEIDFEIIKGFLSETPCYAGRVNFSSKYGTYDGDLILVGYQSQLGSQVNDWFKNNQEWFDKYLLDR